MKAKTEALATLERQRRQYEAMAKSKQQQLDQLASASKSSKEDLEGKVKEALAKAQAAEGEWIRLLSLSPPVLTHVVLVPFAFFSGRLSHVQASPMLPWLYLSSACFVLFGDARVQDPL